MELLSEPQALPNHTHYRSFGRTGMLLPAGMSHWNVSNFHMRHVEKLVLETCLVNERCEQISSGCKGSLRLVPALQSGCRLPSGGRVLIS